MEGGRTPGTFSWPTLGGGLPENINPRQAPEVGERDERVVAGKGVGTTRMERKNSKMRPVVGLVGVRLTEKNEAA